jgi:hypothetical protein
MLATLCRKENASIGVDDYVDFCREAASGVVNA